MRQAAAALAIGAGVGFGVPGIVGLDHFARTGDVWMWLGFPTYGDGPFERIGIETSVPLLGGFVVVCAAEVALGVSILKRAPHTRTASYSLLPLELAYWIGFALPAGTVLGLARVALMAKLGRRPPA
jgi:hypothetical protein